MSKHEEIRLRLANYRKEAETHKMTVQGSRELKPNDQASDNGVDKNIKGQSLHRPVIESNTNAENMKTVWCIFGLKVMLWLVLWGFFIEVGFGLVYLIVSGLVSIILSLRGGRKRAPGELSAYSVFNKNFEAIEGTLSAQQFERELRYGPNSVR